MIVSWLGGIGRNLRGRRVSPAEHVAAGVAVDLDRDGAVGGHDHLA